MFKYLNTPSKGSRHTDYTFVTDRQITHLLQTDRFHICYRTEALTDTAFYSLGCTQTVAFCFSPDGVLRLQTEEEALCECLDVVDTVEMILRQVHCQVACIK